MSIAKAKKSQNIDRCNEISNNIIRYRKLSGLTQGQLAERIDVTQPYLSKIESLTNPTMCSLEVLFDIAEALNIPVYKLFIPADE